MATEATLQTLLGGKAAAKVLLYIENYAEGYARQIARTFEIPLSDIEKLTVCSTMRFEQQGYIKKIHSMFLMTVASWMYRSSFDKKL